MSAAAALAARYGIGTASGPAALPSPGAPDTTALVPVAAPLAPLLAAGGLRRGSVVSVTGSVSLAFALLARASAEDAWIAVVGLPSLGAAALGEAGIAFGRLAAVPRPGPDWAEVVGVLLDAVELVVVRPAGTLSPARARRLAARVRERRGVLVVLGDWEGAEVRLSLGPHRWDGLGPGHGRLRARQVEVRAQGRGAAAHTRRLQLWLPAETGGVELVAPRAA